MLVNWITTNWTRSDQLQSLRNPDFFIFSKGETNSYFSFIYKFLQYMQDFCLVGLEMEEDHVLVQQGVLNFLQEVSKLHSHYKLPFLFLPSSALIMKFLLASNAVSISRIAGILVNYKKEFTDLMKISTHLEFPNGLESKNRFNSYVWIFVSSLWMEKFLAQPPKSSIQDEIKLPQ